MFKPLLLGKNKQKTPVYPTYRSPETYIAYLRQMKESGSYSVNPPCALCNPARVLVEERGPIRVIKNDYPYAIYHGLPVREHLMIITARHVGDLIDLTNEEAAIYWRISADYSGRGYTLFTQASTKSQRSIPGHIHTHLIACEDPSEATDSRDFSK